MLEAVPKNVFSTDYIVHIPGRTSAMVDVSLWRDAADLEIEGVSYRFHRERLMSGAFLLERDGVVIAKAVKPSAFRARFEVDFGGRTFVVRMVSVWRRQFGVFSGEQRVGVIRPAGLFTRRALIELPRDWPVAFELFVFWLVLLMWRRQAAAAAAS
jgi:hypothetical protein